MPNLPQRVTIIPKVAQDFDLVIVGAGPAGISTAVEAREAGIAADRIVVLEKGPAHSYAIRKYYPDDKRVDAVYKGIPAISEGKITLADGTKQQTLDFLDETIRRWELNVRYDEGVDYIKKDADLFEITTPKATLTAKVVVIAIGILGKPNVPDYKIPRAELRGKVHFDVTSDKLAGERALVVGGGDSAADYVHYLVARGFKVDLSYRKPDLTRMNQINVADIEGMAQAGRLELLMPTDIDRLEVAEGRPRAVFRQIEPRVYDHVVYALGGTTPAGFLQATGIEMKGGEPLLREGGETTVSGLFLAGDLTAGKKGGSIISAFNSGVAAMRIICRDYLYCPIPPPPPRKA
ncbi:MAG: NAD(P)-binding domain-containing protein [Myxococcales bacterium]|nr:NAD(P)-binding domain-containing protein [Myxococcales bacterium]